MSGAYAACLAGVYACLDSKEEVEEIIASHLPQGLPNLVMTFLAPCDEYSFWRKRSLTPRIVKRLPMFTRLQYINQHGLSAKTYTRYIHSLGVGELASAAAIGHGADAEQTQTLVTAALLHDVGHCRGSHSADHLLAKRFAERTSMDVYTPNSQPPNHETRAVILIAWVMRRFSNYFFDPQLLLNLATLITGDVTCLQQLPPHLQENKESTIAITCSVPCSLRKIVHNESGLDVDRLDYILRDVQLYDVPSDVKAALCSRTEAISILRRIKTMTTINDDNYLLTKDLDAAFLAARRCLYKLYPRIDSSRLVLLPNELRSCWLLESRDIEKFFKILD